MAQYGQLVHDRADPARSRMQLPPLPGIWPAIVAVDVSTHASRTCVPRGPDCTQSHYHSHSLRETQPHARAWRPTSPVCTATAHTRSSQTQHTVAHSPVPHTHTHTRRGTHQRCFLHTWGFAHSCRVLRARGFLPLRCPFHTRSAGKHARQRTRHHTTRTRGLFRTRGLWHTRCFLNTRGFIHTRGSTRTRGRFRTHPYTPGMRAATHADRECKGVRESALVCEWNPVYG